MEKDLSKTSTKQRIIIIIITIILLGSFIASYIAIILANSSSSGTNSDNELIEKYQNEYDEIKDEIVAKSSSQFKEFIKYKNQIKAFNEESANAAGVVTKDLKKGSGRELKEGDTDYLAYYVGWCPNEDIFDSTFNSNENPTSFLGILDVASLSLIEGWNTGVVGMKIGGIREITIPGELAYGSSTEICGGYNKPLKFMIMAIDSTEELDLARTKLLYAYYGMDYDTEFSEDTEDAKEENE